MTGRPLDAWRALCKAVSDQNTPVPATDTGLDLEGPSLPTAQGIALPGCSQLPREESLNIKKPKQLSQGSVHLPIGSRGPVIALMIPTAGS